jgi:hypothetical protein
MGLREILPITEWLPGYSLKRLGPDGIAGLSLAAFVIPESLAYASLAGLPPVSGLCIATLPPASPMPCLEPAASWRWRRLRPWRSLSPPARFND